MMYLTTRRRGQEAASARPTGQIPLNATVYTVTVMATVRQRPTGSRIRAGSRHCAVRVPGRLSVDTRSTVAGLPMRPTHMYTWWYHYRVRG